MGVTVGFSPAPGAAAVASGGTKPAAASDSPAHLFGTLLQIAGGEAEDAAAGARLVESAAAAIAPQTSGEVELTVPATLPSDPEADPEDLLANLLETLAALEQAVASGAPVDPLLEKKASEALEALADLLGIALPAAPGIDPAISAAGAVAVPVDPLATIAAADTTLPAADGSETDAPLPLKELAEKIAKLADAIEPRSPVLGEQLRALADKLGSGGIDAATIAKLGLSLDPEMPSEIDAAIARLLAPATEAKPAPVPAPFAGATLALPADIALPAKPKAEAPAIAKPAEAATSPAPDTEPTLKVEPAARPDPQAPARAAGPEPDAPAKPGPAIGAAANTAGTTPPDTSAATAGVGRVVTADTKAMHAAYAAPVRQINMPQVAFEIVRQVQAGNSRFQIRLDPPELGRIDVKLEVDKAGNVNARMTVERAETLDLMQRDQRSLERALAQAGLDSNKTNLEFSLRQNPFAHQEQSQGGGNNQSPSPFAGAAEADDSAAIPEVAAYRGTASADGVNLFV